MPGGRAGRGDRRRGGREGRGIDRRLAESLRCPFCRGELTDDERIRCGCGRSYPKVDGRPVLLDERSVFDAETIADAHRAFFRSERTRWVERLPSADQNLVAARNLARMADLIGSGQILVVGGGQAGAGSSALDRPSLRVVNTDVSISPRTEIVCDATALPFADGSFDGIVMQAVLEHVVDPVLAVAEAHRVLRPSGLVYAETPFMQQVHAGRHDFTRFTHLGHRRLFRWFDEIDSGACCGPAMAAGWAFRHLLRSIARTPTQRRVANVVGTVSTAWLGAVDRRVADRPAALDAASGVWFLGRRADTALSDRELLRGYRGAQV